MSVFLPRHLSVSSISLYAKCPAQWKRRYVDRIMPPHSAAQATGIAFHKALEALHCGGDAEMAWLAAADDFSAVLEPTGQALTMSKEHGIKLLGLYRQRGLHTTNGESERMFKLPFPGGKIPVPLLGYIDLTAPGERHYRDFKTTGGSYWSQVKVDLEPQKDAYGWAYHQLYRHRAERALWCIFNTKSVTIDVYETVPSPEAFRVFEQTAELVWDGISHARYDGCGSCPEVCRPKIEKVDTSPSFAWGAQPA